jgi:NADH:ubiquinone oxidoreductase subunit 4 (subunit M)
LPKAHVDAPTSGSVILAGLLLKIGFFGFIRILSGPVFSEVSTDLFAYIAALATVGVLYSSIVNLRQIDLKRIVAYSSIAHMNMALVCLCLQNFLGGLATLFTMFSHGLISSALFFLVGFLYHRFHQRLISYYGGLATVMPIFTIFLFFFSLANMAFPFTAGFIGEFLCLYSLFQANLILGLLNSLSMFFTTVYSMLLFSRVCFGMTKEGINGFMSQYLTTLDQKGSNLGFSIDLSSYEIFILGTLMLFTILLGI